MAQKLSCSQGRHLGQGRASQPGVGGEAVLMGPEAEDGFREADAEACIHLDYESHVEPTSFLYYTAFWQFTSVRIIEQQNDCNSDLTVRHLDGVRTVFEFTCV